MVEDAGLPLLVASGIRNSYQLAVKGLLAARLETRIKESAAHASMVSYTYRHRQVSGPSGPLSC